MSSAGDWKGVRTFVILLVVLQFVAVILAWSLNPVTQKDQTAFALLLSADLVAFAVVSYVGRTNNRGERVRGAVALVGSAVALFFMFMVLLV